MPTPADRSRSPPCDSPRLDERRTLVGRRSVRMGRSSVVGEDRMERFEVEQAVKLAGLELPAGADFEVAGQDPILRSPHYLGNGAAVSRLLTGVAANELWRLRTGRSQRIVVDA